MNEFVLVRALYRGGLFLTILLQVVLSQGTLLVQRAPEYALTAQDWYAGLTPRWAVLEQLDLFDLLGGASGLTQWLAGAHVR
jgi:hypothetical protein